MKDKLCSKEEWKIGIKFHSFELFVHLSSFSGKIRKSESTVPLQANGGAINLFHGAHIENDFGG